MGKGEESDEEADADAEDAWSTSIRSSSSSSVAGSSNLRGLAAKETKVPLPP